ncbi:MAG: T9SS type A sorting domain-containing protein [Bacteroidales bacterium]|nr:T9SS type A sorting domain-containing protein [Bacteroidales bacterium]
MKKRLTFITFLMLLCSVSFGQNNYYTPVSVDPTVYNQSMTIATTVSFEGVEEYRDNLELGVFCNGVCRATTMTKDYGYGKYTALTTFRGKSGEEYTLKVYDHSNKTEHSNYVLSDADGNEFVDNTISFNADVFGTLRAPYNVNFIAPDHFIPEIGDYDYNMTLTAVVLIDGVEQKNDKLELGAFIGDKVVGSSKTDFTYTINEERFYANQMTIAGKDNDVVTFKLYDHENGEELEFLEVNSITFETNKFLGTIAEPIKIDFLTKSYVAQIGETKYETLAAAVDAATAGQTITLRKNAEGSGVVINKNVTIDFGGFTYTFADGPVGSTGTESNGFQILKGNTVTLKNGTLNVDEDYNGYYYMLIQNYANLTVEDMTLDGTNLDKWVEKYGDSYVLSNNSGNVNITGNTSIKANNDGSKAFAFDAYKDASYDAPVVTVNTTGKIEGAVEVSATLNLLAVGTNNITRVDVTGEGQIYNEIAVDNVVVKKVYTNNGDDNLENDWYTIAVPSSVDIANSGLITTESAYALYRYDESKIEEEWINYKNENEVNAEFGTKLQPTTGYLYANAAAKTEATYTVSLNTEESHTMSVSTTAEAGDLAGFYLIGNPFSHDITFAHLRHTSLAQGFYVLEGGGTWVANDNTGTIKAFQGVLIQVGGEGQLAINKKAAQSRSKGESNGSLAINVSNSKYSDIAYVSFNEGLGLTKINHRNTEVPMVYVPVEGKNYAVATMSNDVEEIPFSFEAKTMGQYTISIDAENSDFARVILVDRLTGEETNMLFEDYTFMAKSNDNPERFVLKLTSKSEMNSDNDDFVYIYKNELFISSTSDNAVVEIYDIQGRPVAAYNVNGSTNIPMDNFSNGIYIVRMIEENDVKVQKILID